MEYNSQEELLEELLEDIASSEKKDLVVFNDDFNTFEHVINTLIKVCKHSAEQAEQCAHLVHFKGKCAVKMGTMVELKPMARAICEAGIDAKII